MAKFKQGDIVRFRKDATLGELIANSWGGCRDHTIQALVTYQTNGEFRDMRVVASGLDGVVQLSTGPYVNASLLELVERPVTEVTLQDIADKFGVDVASLRIKEEI